MFDHRTRPQNSFYWGVVVTPIAQHMGADKERVHEYLKKKFLKGNSSTELTIDQFSHFTSQVMNWAEKELDIHIH